MYRIVPGFPGGPVVKNSCHNAKDTGSIPGPGRSLGALEQLSLCATTTEPVLWSPGAATTEALEAMLHNKRRPRNETPRCCHN
jgi:hypothetical protein